MGLRLFPPVGQEKEYAQEYGRTLELENTITRAVFFAIIFLSTLWGLYYYSVSNRPSKVIKESVTASLKLSFNASIEGSVSLDENILNVFRSHQRYKPGQGIIILSDTSSPRKLPFDALIALKSLQKAIQVNEQKREDMYSHGSRHFSGIVTMQENSVSSDYVFEYWYDVRNRLAVRLSFARVDRNAGTDTKGEPVSKETYINIGYDDWR